MTNTTKRDWQSKGRGFESRTSGIDDAYRGASKYGWIYCFHNCLGRYSHCSLYASVCL